MSQILFIQAHSRIFIGLALGLALAGPGRSQSLGFVASPDEVESFDPSSGVIVNSIFVNYGYSYPFAVSSDQQTLYLPGGNLFDVVSAQTGAFLDEISLPPRSHGMKVLLSSDGTRAFVLCSSDSSGSVAVISLTTMKVIRFITASSGVPANDIALSPDGTTLYVAFANNGIPAKSIDLMEPSSTHDICPVNRGVCAFNASTLALTATVKGIAGNLAVSQDGKSLYVCPIASKVYVVNTSTLAIGAIKLPSGMDPVDVIVSPVGNSAIVYSTTAPSGGLGPLTSYVLDTSTNTLTAIFPAASNGATSGGSFGFSAFTPDGSALWTVVTCVAGSVGCTGNPCTLVGQTFPSGNLIAQTALPVRSYFLAF